MLHALRTFGPFRTPLHALAHGTIAEGATFVIGPRRTTAAAHAAAIAPIITTTTLAALTTTLEAATGAARATKTAGASTWTVTAIATITTVSTITARSAETPSATTLTATIPIAPIEAATKTPLAAIATLTAIATIETAAALTAFASPFAATHVDAGTETAAAQRAARQRAHGLGRVLRAQFHDGVRLEQLHLTDTIARNLHFVGNGTHDVAHTHAITLAHREEDPLTARRWPFFTARGVT